MTVLHWIIEPEHREAVAAVLTWPKDKQQEFERSRDESDEAFRARVENVIGAKDHA
jgi:hypothetical protein